MLKGHKKKKNFCVYVLCVKLQANHMISHHYPYFLCEREYMPATVAFNSLRKGS